MLDRKLIDVEFPFFKDVIFLNAALVIIPPRSVQEAYFGFTRDYIENFADGVMLRASETIGEARKSIAALIGAKPQEIGFIKNTSEGVGILAGGYPFAPGDNVIVVDQEHPANLYAWIALQAKGVELRVVPSRNGKIFVDDFLTRMDGRTRVVAVSAVQYSTGARVDLQHLGAVCHERNVVLAVDGIQAVGRLATDVKKLRIKYLSCGGHKGLLAVTGVGFVFCDESLAKKITPPYACYQNVRSDTKPPAQTTDFSKLDWHDDSRRFEAGNLNYAGIAAVGAGTRLLNTLGIEQIECHIAELEEQLIDGLRSFQPQFRSPLEKEFRSGIVCLYYLPEKEAEVSAILKRYRIYATSRGGYIRLSINFYNTREQISKTIEAFREIGRLAEKAQRISN